MVSDNIIARIVKEKSDDVDPVADFDFLTEQKMQSLKKLSSDYKNGKRDDFVKYQA